MKKALVMYSGGLDSRLVVKILKEQGFEVEALHFVLPFGCGCCNLNCNFNFTQKEGVKLITIDVSKEPLLSEYLEVVKNPKYGYGAGMNPCKDCKIFMFKKAKEYADKNGIEIIASGEVLGQRPMSQTSKAREIIDEDLGFEILRPLSAKKLPETSWEKKGLVDRSKLFGISGRGRKKQMALAEKWGINYPSPGGGCLLCEKELKKRFRILLNNGLLNDKTLKLSNVGRHFFIDGIWFVVARNAEEGKILNHFDEFVLEGEKGKPDVFYNKEEGKEKAKELQEAYRTGAGEEERRKFDEWKI